MTHRERVQTALSHQQPDRVPLEMSFTPEFAQRLRSHLFGEAGGRHNPHGGGNDYALDLAIERSAKLLRFYIGKGAVRRKRNGAPARTCL